VSEARISHEDLTNAVRRITDLRDKALVDADKDTRLGKESLEQARAYALALDAINVWSKGEYGQDFYQQRAQSGGVL
jgi:hypothetical protein